MFAKYANNLWPQEPMTLFDCGHEWFSAKQSYWTARESTFLKRSSKDDKFGLPWGIPDHSIFNILDISHDLRTYYRTILIYSKYTLPGWLQQLLSKLASKSSQ